MMERRLQNQLGALESMLRRARLRRRLAFCWATTAVAGLLLLLVHGATGWDIRLPWWLVLIGGGAAAVILWRRGRHRPADFRAVVGIFERENPDVRHLLSTAAEQEPNPESGQFGYLQLRVIEQVLTHRHKSLWEQDCERKLTAAGRLQLAAFAALLVVFLVGGSSTRWHAAPGSAWFADEITVTPGDAQVERGTGLVITARFGRTPPPEAALVLVSASGQSKRIALARTLADPVFGTSLAEISEDGFYHIEYGTKKTRDYKLGVFDYPALTRADASLRFPDYTGLTNQLIRDTRRVSAVAGTRLTYTLQLNKPVARARFVGKIGSLTLKTDGNSVALLDNLTLTNSARYTLELVDAEGRTNKAPAEFSLQVLPDRPPVVKVVFPRGDQRVSSLEELQLQGEARDDFGLLKYGLGFSVAGQEPQFIELGQAAPANEKRQFTQQIALEKLGVAVDQVVSYFAWADDYGPDGKVRRTFSDMFFAEVRPFEEVFRADQSGASESQNQQGNQGGNQNVRLAELQKQIVIATWKLQQDKQANALKP